MEKRIRRNYIQNEKDMIKQCYEITHKEVEEIEAELLNKDAEMERFEENHQSEVKVYMQKVKHLEYDHKNSMLQVDGEARHNHKDEANDHILGENIMKKDKIDIRTGIGELELSNVADVTRMNQRNDRELEQLGRKYKSNIEQLEEKYMEKHVKLVDDLELRLKVEIHEIEERKNQHKNDLMQDHELAYRDLKAYYNDITQCNLDIIRNLREDKKKLEEQHENNQKKIITLRSENTKIEDELEIQKNKNQMLEVNLAQYPMDKMSLANAKQRKIVLEKKFKERIAQKEELFEKYREAEAETGDLGTKYELALGGIKEKADYKNVHLDQRLQAFEEHLQRKEAQLNEVLRRVDLDPRFVADISKKIEDSLEVKNTILKNLKYSLAHATKAYNDAIRVYEAKLEEFGIPAEELGFQPLETNTSTMPAGLVAA